MDMRLGECFPGDPPREMRAPIHPAGGRPSTAKGEGGDPRKGRGGQPPNKANKTPKSKGSSKGHHESAKRPRRSSPGPNSVEVGRGDKTPPARSPTRDPAKRRPVSAPPGKGPQQAAMAKKIPKTDQRSPSKQSDGPRSPEKTKKASSMPSSRASSTSSVKRSRKASATEVILANGESTEILPSGEDTTLQQRIAKSIEAVINTLGKESALSPPSRPPSRPPDAKEKPKSTVSVKSKITGSPKEGVLEGGKDAAPLEREATPKKRGRPKGSKNKVKKDGEGKKVKGDPRKKKGGKLERLAESRSLERTGESPLKKKGRPEGRPSKISKTPSKKKVVSSKLLKRKDTPSKIKLKAGHKRGSKVGSAPKVKTKAAGSRESSPSSAESDAEQDDQRREQTPQSRGRPPKSKPLESPTHERSSSNLETKTPKKIRLPYPPKNQSKGGKASNSDNASWKPNKEASSSASDEETEVVARPLKKVINEKWSQHLRKAAKAKGTLPPSPDPPPPEAKATSPRRRRERLCYFSPLDSDLDSDSEYSGSSSPQRQKEGRKRSSSKGGGKRKKKKSVDELPTQVPKRTAKRMASLNALALMSCMMEDSKVPLPSPPQPSPPAAEAPSMALLLRESTIAHSHSGDDSDDSEEGDSENLPSASRVAVQKRKVEVPASPPTSPPNSSSTETKAKAPRRHRRGEVDLTMDMKDMVVTKRIACLNALAKMAAASCPSEPRRRQAPPPPAPSAGSEVTNVDIKRKISIKATEASKSVITVHETKKVKKAGATEVEEQRIVVKKKSVRRQGGPRVGGPSEREDEGGNATDGSDQLHLEDDHLLPKSPVNDSGLLLESTLTLATPPIAPGTVTLSGVSKYLITSADGRTTTVVQQVQQQQRQAPHTAAAPSPPGQGCHLPKSSPLPTPVPIPTAHIPPSHHVQVPHHEGRGGPTRTPASYSPLGALEVMQPLIHPHHPPPNFIPYPPSHPPHGPPLLHPHHVHHHPPPHLPPHHHPHPSPPYPPLSPHSPPYPPPPPLSASSSPSPSSEPPHPCQPPGYRSPPPCSNGAMGFPPPVSSPKQSQGVLPFKDPSPNARVYPPPNGPPERHQSAFSAPMSSAHAPAATANPPTHGPSQNVLCCPAGSSKNVPPGPLTATGKGPGSEYGLKKLPPVTNAPVCPNNYHGGSKVHIGAQVPHANRQSLMPTPPPSVPPKPYTGSQPQETSPRETPTQQTPLIQQNPSQERRVKDSACVFRKSRCPEGTKARLVSPLENTHRSVGENHKNKPPPALSPPRTPTSTSSSTNGLECQFSPTSGAVGRGSTHPAPLESSLLTLAVSLANSSPRGGVPGVNKGPVAPRDRKVSASGSNGDCSDSGDGSVGLPPTPSTGNRSSPSGASIKALDKSASSSSTSSPDLPTTRACGLGPAASAVPVFPAMPDGSRALQITKWVVQSSASPVTAPTPLSSTPSCPSSRGEVPPPHQGLLSPTGTTTSISPSNTNASTNSVMSTTAPIVASLERTVRTVLDSRASKPKEDPQRDVRWKEASTGREQDTPASQRTGGRHLLLCQPVPLSHIKMPSVQAKAKPSPQAGTTGKNPAPDEASHKDLQTGGPPSSTITCVASPVSHQSGTEAPLESNDPLIKEGSRDHKEMMIPRKRVRPPKNRDNPPIPTEAPPSNGAQEKREHFWCAPGETNIREEAPRRSSGAKPFLASLPSSPKRAKGPLLPTPMDGGDPQEELQDIKISVKTEAIGKIKTEKISPRQAIFRDQKLKPLNGDTDAAYGTVCPKDIKTLLLPPPSLNLGSLDRKASDGLKTEVEADLPKSEEKKVCLKRRLEDRGTTITKAPVEPPKGSKVQKPLPGRGKSPKVKLGRTWPKVRKKASLLAYLKERNNESDASNGEGDAVEDELRKLIEKDDPKALSPFTGYLPLSVRGRRISGAGRGKSVRKPRYYHGWSWEGDAHESKVWLRNDEMLMMRRCYKAMRHKEGDMIRVRDCVLLRSGPRKTDLPFVAKVASLWEDPETNDMMMSILWYYRPEHTDVGRREEDLEDEIFASKHRDHLSVACIEDRCYVLTFNEYCRYRRLLRVFQERLNPQLSPVPDTDESYLRKERQPPGWVVPDLLFFCRKVYDYRQKRILKNPC